VVVLWAITGPFFGYSDTWQLVINTGTTIVTFLMVFLMQATQDRDSKAIQLKLDELLRAISKARTGLVGLEDMDKEDIKRIEAEFGDIKLVWRGRERPEARMSVRMHHDRKRYVVYCAQSYLAEGWIGTWLGAARNISIVG
jgi:low affinity Fe/Cu permease